MVTKKPLAITLGITDNWAFSAGTVLLGLQKYPLHRDYDLIIFNHDLSAKNQQLLSAIYPTIFVEYKKNIGHSNKFSRISNMAFSRYECFGLLEKYNQVLWLDADVLIKGDIHGLVDITTSGLALFNHTGTPLIVSFSSPIPGFDLSRDCLNDGVFLLNDSLPNPNKLKAWCYEKTDEWASKINSDQAIINLMIQRFDLQVTSLPLNYNCHPLYETNETIIVHPWGERKFWNGYVDPLWDEFYFQWRDLGGDGPLLKRGFTDQYAILRTIRKRWRSYLRHLKKK